MTRSVRRSILTLTIVGIAGAGSVGWGSGVAAAAIPAAIPTAAKAVPVTAGRTTGGVDATIRAGGAISGTVTSAATSVGGTEIIVYLASGAQVSAIDTATDGSYTVRGLLPSSAGYLVCAPAREQATVSAPYGYGRSCYGGTNSAEGTAVPVTSGQTHSGVDIDLDRVVGGAITGTVTDPTYGGSLTNAAIRVLTPGGREVNTALSHSDGSYTVAGLPPTAVGYRVCFVAPPAGRSPTGYLGQCARALIPVAARQAHTDVDAGLQPSGAIAGIVRSKAGISIGDLSVFAFGPNGVRVADGVSSATGRYRIRNLEAGKYRICTDDNRSEERDGPTRFDGRCLGNIRWFTSVPPTSTTPVAVASGTIRRHVNLVLMRHKFVPTGTIAGQVTKASSGAPIESVTVYAFTRDRQLAGQVDTDQFGKYRLTVPASAGYVICFGG